MWKFQPIRIVILLFLFLTTGSVARHLWAVGPITSLSIGGVTGQTFIAGTATNTIVINTFANVGSPDADQVVTLELLDQNDNVLEHGISPTFITTTGGVGNGCDCLIGITFFRSGTNTLKIRASIGGISDTKETFTVNTGSATKLLLIDPSGMTHVPGTNPDIPTTGISGSSLAKEPFQNFTLRAILTDNQFNRIENATHTVTLAATGLETKLVSFAASSLPLVQGQVDFTVTLNGAKIVRNITASSPGILNGDLSVTTDGPPAEEVFPYPSPFNPRSGNITFRYRITANRDVNIIVTDIFGQKVWEKSEFGQSGINDTITWNGRNGKGEVVAAGVYYVLFEAGGEIKSKRRFGVVK